MKTKKRPVYNLKQIRTHGYPKGPWRISKKDSAAFKKLYTY